MLRARRGPCRAGARGRGGAAAGGAAALVRRHVADRGVRRRADAGADRAHGAAGDGGADVGRGPAARRDAQQPAPLPGPGELRHELRFLPGCGRAAHPAGDGELLGRLWRRAGAAVAAPVRRGRRRAGGMGGGRAPRTSRHRHRQPGHTRPLLPAGVRRAVVHPRHRRRRARRGEVCAGHLRHRRPGQPVLHARRQRLAQRPLRRPARAWPRGARGAVAAEQPRRPHPARRRHPGPHGRRGPGAADAGRTALCQPGAGRGGPAAGPALARTDRAARRPPCRPPTV